MFSNKKIQENHHARTKKEKSKIKWIGIASSIVSLLMTEQFSWNWCADNLTSFINFTLIYLNVTRKKLGKKK